MKLRIAALALSILLISAAPARAVVVTWTGNGDNGILTGLNWSTSPFAPLSGDDLIFPYVANRTVTFDQSLISVLLDGGNVTVGNITFSGSTAGNYVLNGTGSPTLQLNGDLSAANSPPIAITFESTLGIELPTGEHVFNISTGNTVQVDGVISGLGHLSKTGAGTLVLTGINTYNYTDYPNFLDATSIHDGTLHVNGGTINHTGAGDIQISLNASDSGSLVIDNGGTVNDHFGVLAQGSGSTATATVSGAGSSWNNSSGMDIGRTGVGTLNILAGADVTITGTSAYVGLTSTGVGTVNVDGAGSTWTSGGDLTLGGAGTGSLTVSNGASVSFGGGTGLINLATSGSGNGTLNIGALAGDPAAAGGSINADTITTVAGTGTVQFNTTATSGSPYYLTRDGTGGGTPVIISGDTDVIFSNGYNVVAATNDYSGATTINGGTAVALSQAGSLRQFGYGDITVESGGTLLLKGTTTLENNLVTVNAGGKLAGDGGIGSNSGRTTVMNSGSTLAPGISGATAISTLSFDDLTLKGGGLYEWNLKAPTGLPGANWDLVSISNYSYTLHFDSSVTTGNKFTIKAISLDASGNPGTATGFANQTYNWVIFEGGPSAIDFANTFDPAMFDIDASAFVTDLGPGVFTISQDTFSNTLVLNFTPVPEPSTYALLALGLAGRGLAAWRKSRRSV